MKRLFILLLALVMAFSLVACGGGDEDKTPSGSDTPPSSEQQEQQPSNAPDNSQPSGGEWGYAEYTDGVPEPKFTYSIFGVLNQALSINGEASADEIGAWKQTLLDNGAEEVREGDTWAVRDGKHLIEMNGITNGVAYIYISLDTTPVSGGGQPAQSGAPDPSSSQGEDNGDDVEIKGEAWPENEFTAQMPKPRNGVVDAENSTEFGCSISLVMTEEEVAEYAADLIAAGFEGEWKDSSKMYSGKNSEGYKVSLMYNGPKTICSISKE